MAGSAITITNHEKIREWVAARDERPVSVYGMGLGSDLGSMWIDFPADRT